MTRDPLGQAKDDFWLARNGGPFPAHWEDRLDQDQAHQISLDLTARHVDAGDEQAGWKVGLTGRAVRDQLGVSEPVFGVLFASGRWPNDGTWTRAEYRKPGWENEIAVTMAKRLQGPGLTDRDALEAIATVSPALEIFEVRHPEPLAGLNALAADNWQQRAFVLGPETPAVDAASALGSATLEVFVDGKSQETADGRSVMETGPVASVAWLANRLAAFGRAIEVGEVVLTGSFTRQYFVDRPMSIEARFEPFGSATATFV
ncbi:MAG: 2-keto-4-pentenoate hydratase [Alphaproteobacteria bacterium]|nr:2-keto-4-pentenoate hydratase [Alphaproteobacteria bacterium]